MSRAFLGTVGVRRYGVQQGRKSLKTTAFPDVPVTADAGTEVVGVVGRAVPACRYRGSARRSPFPTHRNSCVCDIGAVVRGLPLPNGVSQPLPVVSASSSSMNPLPVIYSPADPAPRPWNAPASETNVPTWCPRVG